jgi:RNA polymerase sigma factor (sigma-70 family)
VEREVARSDDPEVLVDLARCLRALSERERRVIELVYLEGRSYEESGALLNMPHGTLRAIRTRALKKLRRAMLDRRLGKPAHRDPGAIES